MLDHLVLGIDFTHERIPVADAVMLHQSLDHRPTRCQGGKVEVLFAEIAQTFDGFEALAGDTFETHAPVGILPRLDRAATQHLHRMVAGILADHSHQIINNPVIALDDLKEGAIGKKQHAGDFAGQVIAATLHEQ